MFRMCGRDARTPTADEDRLEAGRTITALVSPPASEGGPAVFPSAQLNA